MNAYLRSITTWKSQPQQLRHVEILGTPLL